MILDKKDLKKFLRLWRRIEANGNGESVFHTLKRAYAERHRKYHDAEHVRHCLIEFGTVWRVLREPSAVEMAIWFHDAVFVPGASDNEDRSAKLAQEMLWAGGVSDEMRMRVADLIMATKHDGKLSPRDPDAIMLADIDLSPLGAHPKLFDENAQLIRREMRMSNEEFFRKQALFFEKLFQRKSIYGTDFFYDKCERQARKNIKRFALRAGVTIQ